MGSYEINKIIGKKVEGRILKRNQSNKAKYLIRKIISLLANKSFFFLNIYLLFISERETDRDRDRDREREREREREMENLKQALGSERSAQSLMRGLNSQTAR